jgi:hypothetical protein
MWATGDAQAQGHSLYESQRVARVLQARSLQLEPRPEGKRIAFVTLAREDVFVDDELWWVWPNLFHWLTREEVIRREVLLRSGDTYDAARIEESTRNLRNLEIFTLVRIVAVRGPDPDTVGLVVYTRDLWSLRLETVFAGTGGAFAFAGTLSERNFLGKGKLLSLNTFLDPKSISVGQLYRDTRVFGGELLLKESLDLIINRESGRAEGSEGAISFGRPFYDLQQRWSWTLAGSYAVLVARALRGADIVSFRPDAGGRLEQCAAPAPDCVRSVWDDRSARATLSASYRRGERFKQTFTATLGFSDRDVAANAETELLEEQRTTFERRLLPRAERQVYPALKYQLDLPLYVTYFNLGSFGQSEPVRIGPVVTASASLPLEAFGSSHDSFNVASSIGYVLGDGRMLLEGEVSGSTRLLDGQVSDQYLGAYLRGATPSWFAGRLLFLASWEGRRRDSTQSQAVLGGDNGLRGYASGAFRVVGGNRLRWNFEYRSLPMVFQAIHLGGVLFYDGGSVYASSSQIPLRHAVGVGARVLFPHFNRSVFRGDLGFPLHGGGVSVMLSYGGAQAVPLTASEDLAAAASVSSGAR